MATKKKINKIKLNYNNDKILLSSMVTEKKIWVKWHNEGINTQVLFLFFFFIVDHLEITTIPCNVNITTDIVKDTTCSIGIWQYQIVYTRVSSSERVEFYMRIVPSFT